jgi:ketosteroid isomerase-like protein
MTEGNVEIVSRMYESFRRRDGDTALSYLDRDVVIDASHRVDGRVGRGKDEVGTILGEWLTTWQDWEQEVQEIRDLGERVLVIETQRGRGKESGVGWEGRFGMLYELRDGKVMRWTINDDLGQAFEAVGLSE